MAEEIEKNSTYTYTKVKAGSISWGTAGRGSAYTQSDLTDEEYKALTLSLKKLPMLFCSNYQRLNYFV